MSYRKISLTFLMLFVFTSSVNAACDFKNLNSCSVGDLMSMVNSLIVPNTVDSKTVDCPSIYLPVCGKDKNTYQNSCFLLEEGIRLDYLGSCLEEPNNLRASDCVRDGYDWSGYRCFDKNKEDVKYSNSEIGLEFDYPSDAKLINTNLIDLVKERKDTNLISKRLEILSGEGCDNFKYYTNILSEEEETINGNKFTVIESEESLEYGKNIFADIKYKSYVYNENDKCINLLFSLISDPNSNYDNYTVVDIEPNAFLKIVNSVSINQGEKKQSPCDNFGDLNEDGYITISDIALLEYGTIQNNFQKRGDVNGDNFISDEDKMILIQYNNSLIDDFPACSEKQLESKKGASPSYIEVSSNFDKNTNIVDFVIEVYADNGDVLIPAFIDDSINFEILNSNIIDIVDAGLNTSASITEDGFIFIKGGDSEWINANFELKANTKPVYSNVLINGINYLDEDGNISSYDLSSESKKVYLNYITGQEKLPPCEKYGDINLDGYVTNDDIWAFRLNEYKKNADLNGDGEITLRDFLELKNYLEEKELFSVCKIKTIPVIYNNGITTIENKEGNVKRVFLTFYADSKDGDSYIPSELTFNQDDTSAGIYIDIERDGYLNISDLEVHTSANYTRDGLFKLKKDLPQWFRVEFNVESIKDTALANFKVNKIAYLNNEGEREYLYPENIETGDIFLNYEQEKIIAPCDSLGDLDLDGFITIEDYNYLKSNTNLLFKDSEKFILADVNKDGKNNEKDLEEINDLILSNTDSFSGCAITLCNSEVEIAYTKDGYLYSNECYAKLDEKEVKCKIGSDLTCVLEQK